MWQEVQQEAEEAAICKTLDREIVVVDSKEVINSRFKAHLNNMLVKE
jgi:hypothetical protein